MNLQNHTNITGGFEREDAWRVLPFEIFHGIKCIFILIGIVGNSLVIFIQKRLGGMRVGGATSTNRLLLCLATADLLTAIFLLPIPRLVNIPNNTAGKIYCHVINSRYLLWVSFRASVYTLTTIAIERFIAIVYPYSYKVWAKNDYVKYAILAIWLCPAIMRFPGIYFRVVGDSGRCMSKFPSLSSLTVYNIVLFLGEFVFPSIIMIYTSMRIIAVLRRNRFDHGDKGDHQQPTQLQSMRRRFTIMFIFICASFMILWTPDQLCIFLYRIRVLPGSYVSSVAFDVFVTVAYLNAAIANPIIYSVCLPTFRRALKDLIMCRGMDKSQTPIMAVATTSMTSNSA